MTAPGMPGGDTAAAAPVVTGISPASGPTAGGTQVTVTGRGFTGTTAVNFGADAALDISVTSDAVLTVTSPPVTASGAANLTVTTPAGMSAASAAGQFTYLAAGLMFLSWYRTGLGAAVQAPPGGAPLDTPAPAAVTATVSADIGDPDQPGDITPDSPATGTVQVRLHAPGDVTGLDAAQILRTHPTPGALNVPPDCFPLIEFAHPNVPWLLSPTGPQKNHPADTDPRRGLTPWLCLAVVPETPPTALSPPAAPGGLPTLTVTDSELPDIGTAWLWAHAQWMTLSTDNPAQTLPSLISQHGDRALSRLLAPRYLHPNTAYLACVVPTFAPPADGAATLSPAWQHSSPPAIVTVPVYYSWRFTTGSYQADFKTLVQQLKRGNQPGAGVRPLDVGDAGTGMPSPAPGKGPWLIVLEGALVSKDVVPGAWTDPAPGGPRIDPAAKYQIQQGLADRLNGRPGELTPPVYGSTQASFRGPLSASVPPSSTTTSSAAAAAASTAAGQAPSVTGISPPSGSAAGGDSVTVTGSGFTGATAVSFGPALVTGLTIDSDTQLTVTSPAAADSGLVHVTVTTPAGTSAASPQDQFTYVPAWLRTLNLDPRYRGAASLGADLVRANQDALILSAWDQAGQARTANVVLRQGQLAREAGQSTYTRRIGGIGPAAQPMDDDRLLQVTRAVHAQIPAPPSAKADGPGQPTVADAVAAKPAVAAALTVPFRRLASPAGPVASRLTTSPLPPPVTSLARTGGIAPTPPLVPVSGMQALTSVSDPADKEYLQRITAQRVTTSTLPWEQGSSASKPASSPAAAGLQAQPGYLADLWVFGCSLGRGLDWDGKALLGWTDPPGISNVSVQNPPIPDYPIAASLISWGPPATAVPALAIAQMSYQPSPGNPNQLTPQLVCALRGDAIPSVPTADSPVQAIVKGGIIEWPTIPIYPYDPGGFAICTGDLTGSGTPSIAVAWIAGPNTQVRVLVDVDVTLKARQTISPDPLYIGAPQAVALANGRLFVLGEYALCSAPVNVTTGRIDLPFTAHTKWEKYLPGDRVSTTITAADFTGTGTADLLFFHAVPVPGALPWAVGAAAYKAVYRIGYELDASGEPAYWGEEIEAQIPVTELPASLVVGQIDAQTASLRQSVTKAFRAAAATTQARLSSVIPPPDPPPPPPPVDVAGLASAVRGAIDPQATVPDSVTRRLSLPAALDTPGGDVLQPLGFTPFFPQPFFETVRDGALWRLIPGLSSFPDEAITVLSADLAVIEAILVGASHELSRELLWRGVPVLRTATFFQRFWDRRDAAGKPLPDITGDTGISAWAAGSDLGSHYPGQADPGRLAVLAWRGKLVSRFPHVTIYAAPAVPVQGGNGTSRTIDLTTRIDPLFSGSLAGDSAFAGFPFTIEDAIGNSSSPGYYFVFQEHPAAPRFGLSTVQDPVSFGNRPAAWAGLDWSATVPDQASYDTLTYLDASLASPLRKASLPDTSAAGATTHQWGFSAAHMAYITCQQPVQVAIHADVLLATAGSGGTS